MRKKLLPQGLVAAILFMVLLACKKEVPRNAGSGFINENTTGNRKVYPPIAYAGADTTIYPPFSGYYLNSAGTTDQDNNITSLEWRFLSGPTTPTIQRPTAIATNASNLSMQGTYSFELTVKDKDNQRASDTVLVTVGNPHCTGQLEEIVLSNLQWEFSWIMDLNIEISKALPPHSKVKTISIKRDNSNTWQPVVILDMTSPDYTFHTWTYGTNTLAIYPNNNTVNDTPDVKIEYCH